MAGPAPETLTDIPPAAREAVSALTAAPGEPVKILVSGGIGTGKSSRARDGAECTAGGRHPGDDARHRERATIRQPPS